VTGILVEDQIYPLSFTIPGFYGHSTTWNGQIEVKVCQRVEFVPTGLRPPLPAFRPVTVGYTYCYQVTSSSSNQNNLYGVQVFTQSKAAGQQQWAGYLPGTNQINPTWAVNNYGTIYALPQVGTYFSGFGGGSLGVTTPGLQPGKQTNWFYLVTDDTNYTSGQTGDTIYFDVYGPEWGHNAPSISGVWCPN
jgi:hypothetical protein